MPLGNAATARIPDAVVPEDRRDELAAGRRWIAEQCLAGRILAVANSEPGAGGDLAQTKTLAARGADGTYRLSGKKSFATIGPDADYFLCAARRVGEGRDGKDVIDGFFVARTAAGVTLDNAWDPLGMRATASVGLSLDQAPAASVLGFSGCLEGVNARHWSTVLFAAVFVGIGEGALDAATQGVGGSGAASSYIRATLARCALNLDAAAGLVEAVASDERWPLPRRPAIARSAQNVRRDHGRRSGDASRDALRRPGVQSRPSGRTVPPRFARRPTSASARRQSDGRPGRSALRLDREIAGQIAIYGDRLARSRTPTFPKPTARPSVFCAGQRREERQKNRRRAVGLGKGWLVRLIRQLRPAGVGRSGRGAGGGIRSRPRQIE